MTLQFILLSLNEFNLSTPSFLLMVYNYNILKHDYCYFTCLNLLDLISIFISNYCLKFIFIVIEIILSNLN